MTALAVGASVTVAVRDGGTVAIATNGGMGSAVITLTEGGSSTVNLGPAPERRILGPFREGASVVITNSSSGGFDYDAETTFDPSNVAITGGAINGVQFGEYYGRSSTSLKKWRAALARSKNGGAVARIACIGDSTTRGAWSTNSGGQVNVVPKGWPAYLAREFTAAGYKGNSESWFGSGNFAASLSVIDQRVIYGGGWGDKSGVVPSLGGVMPRTNGTGVLSFTPSVARTSYDVYYPRNLLGTMNVDIGGVGTILISEAPASSIFKTTITGGSSSTSPLNLTWVSGTNLVIGIEGKDPSDVVSVMNMGQSSSVAADWVTNPTDPWGCLLALPFVAPDLTIISLTINDWVQATNVDAYKVNMQLLISAALQTGDVMLLTGVPSNTANASTANQAAIVAANYALAASNGIPMVDITNRWTSYAVSQPLGLYGDTALHPNGVGYADIATCIVHALTV